MFPIVKYNGRLLSFRSFNVRPGVWVLGAFEWSMALQSNMENLINEFYTLYERASRCLTEGVSYFRGSNVKVGKTVITMSSG